MDPGTIIPGKWGDNGEILDMTTAEHSKYCGVGVTVNYSKLVSMYI